MFRAALAISALLIAAPASAQEAGAISSEMSRSGLGPVEARLAALPSPSPDETLALGAVRFLRALEQTLQTRWENGMTADLMGIPVLRLAVPDRPDRPPFDPDTLNRLFGDLLTDLGAARAAFDAVADDSDAALELNLADLWFDIDGDGARSPGESLLEVASAVIRLPRDIIPPTIRFDTADAAWASAYTHLLSAISEIVLAFDPAPQVARVIAASEAMEALGAPAPFRNAMDMQFGREIDIAAMVYFALQTQPDPVRTRAARLHLLDMIADNRVFWTRVAAETDNAAEWIPNDRQTSALGLEFPATLGDRWETVLNDGEALLQGEKLIPHWRLRNAAGINLRKLMENPPPVDIAEWAHGAGLIPYAEAGEPVTADSLNTFSDLVGGDAILFMFVLN
jgi:hypothetical protein